MELIKNLRKDLVSTYALAHTIMDFVSFYCSISGMRSSVNSNYLSFDDMCFVMYTKKKDSAFSG